MSENYDNKRIRESYHKNKDYAIGKNIFVILGNFLKNTITQIVQKKAQKRALPHLL